MRLYEIPNELRLALESLEVDEDTGEILNPEILTKVESAAKEKIEAAALFCRELDSEATAVKDEADRLAARARALTSKSARIKALLEPALESLGGKVKTGRISVFFRTSKSVEVSEGVELPDEFTRKYVTPDKPKIKEALSAGMEIPGCALVSKRSITTR